MKEKILAALHNTSGLTKAEIRGIVQSNSFAFFSKEFDIAFNNLRKEKKIVCHKLKWVLAVLK